MGKLILQDDILDRIKEYPFLLAEIATVMGIRTAYLLRLIRENDVRLTQASVTALIKKSLNVSDKDLLTEEINQKAVA